MDNGTPGSVEAASSAVGVSDAWPLVKLYYEDSNWSLATDKTGTKGAASESDRYLPSNCWVCNGWNEHTFEYRCCAAPPSEPAPKTSAEAVRSAASAARSLRSATTHARTLLP